MKNSMTSNNLDMNLIVAAFETLAIHNDSQSISRADKYILECQKNPYFSMALMNILSQLPNSQTKFQILIHLKNVIKRNWTSKRRVNQLPISQQMKEQIKAKLIDLYKQNWKIYYKQFNQIFRELSRFDFPKNYHLLNVFVFQVLTSLSNLSIEQILSSQQLLPYLSLVKVVYKEYGQRRILHTQQTFTKYIAKNIQISANIMHKINDALLSIKANLHQVDPELGIKLLECSRKIDKIILYCLHSIVPSLQFDPKIKEIVKFQLGKIQTLATIESNTLNQSVQLNILAILEGVSKLQQFFPLLLTQFLYQYLQLIIQLLLQKTPKQQKLINCIIKSNIMPLKSFTYYMSGQEFKSTLEYKMNNTNQNQQCQVICYNTFKTVYSPENVGLFLEKIVGDLMNRYSRANEEDQIIFQDAEHTYEGTNQQGTFQLLVSLLKKIISTFPEQSKLFIQKLINHLLSQQTDINSKQVQNMYEIILMLPKLMQQSIELNINMATIYVLMQRSYTNYKFDLFCRLIRNFSSHFDNDTLSKSFDILIDIIGNNQLQHYTMYQCVVCIRRIIVEHEDLPFNFDKIGSCLVKIFQLIEIYRLVPTHLWNLINLLISFLKSLSENIIISNLVQLSSCVNMIASTKFQNGSMIICAICDLLHNLLTLINPNDNNNLQQKLILYNSAINLLVCFYKKGTSQQQSQTEDAKNLLWLCIIKNISVNQVPIQMKDTMLVLYQNMKQSVIEQQPSFFFEILEEYYIGGFVQLSLDDIHSLYINLVQNSEPDNDIRINMGFFTLYLSYSLMTNNFDQRLLVASMQKIKQIFKRISPTLNSLRTLLLLIISNALIFVGTQKVLQLFNQHSKDYKQWFYPYMWSLQYINNRYSAKVTSIAVLRSLGVLKNVMCQLIDGSLPFDYIIKFITYYVQPIQLDEAINGYSICLRMFSHHEQLRSKNKISGNKIQSRKAKLHVNANFCELNLAPIYKNEIGSLFKEWDWGVDDLQERYTDGLIQKITGLLNS